MHTRGGKGRKGVKRNEKELERGVRGMDSASNLINIGIKKLQCCVAVQGVGAASRFEGKGYEAAHGLAGLGNTQYTIHNTQYTVHNT